MKTKDSSNEAIAGLRTRIALASVLAVSILALGSCSSNPVGMIQWKLLGSLGDAKSDTIIDFREFDRMEDPMTAMSSLVGKRVTFKGLRPTSRRSQQGHDPDQNSCAMVFGSESNRLVAWANTRPDDFEYRGDGSDAGLHFHSVIAPVEVLEALIPLDIHFDVCSDAVKVSCDLSSSNSSEKGDCPFSDSGTIITGTIAAARSLNSYRDLHINTEKIED
ncbi:MAG: hypothetical protein IPK50_05770 [Fibrobacterota bacterium]|nr:MAG: hypothetical protein IPK50_05770 [Fibrobacterota bacterium]